MAEDQELVFCARWRDDAEVIAAMFLGDALDCESVLAPFGGDDGATAVGGGFVEAGGFGDDETAEGGEHLWDGGLQESTDLRCERGDRHRGNMLTMVRRMSNAGRECFEQ